MTALFGISPKSAAIALAATAALITGVGIAAIPSDDVLPFEVTRNGKDMGTHVLRFSQDGERTIVDIDINFRAGLGPITFFRYEHSNREIWEGDKLISMESTTNDNGTDYFVNVSREDDTLVVESQNGIQVVPGDLLPSTYWRYEMMQADRVINSQRGTILDVTSDDLGRQVHMVDGMERELDCYLMKSRIMAEVCYTPETREWARMAFEARGQEIVYTRTASLNN